MPKIYIRTKCKNCVLLGDLNLMIKACREDTTVYAVVLTTVGNTLVNGDDFGLFAAKDKDKVARVLESVITEIKGAYRTHKDGAAFIEPEYEAI